MADNERLTALAAYLKTFSKAPPPDQDYHVVFIRHTADPEIKIKRVLLAYDALGMLVKGADGLTTAFYFWRDIVDITPN